MKVTEAEVRSLRPPNWLTKVAPEEPWRPESVTIHNEGDEASQCQVWITVGNQDYLFIDVKVPPHDKRVCMLNYLCISADSRIRTCSEHDSVEFEFLTFGISP